MQFWHIIDVTSKPLVGLNIPSILDVDICAIIPGYVNSKPHFCIDPPEISVRPHSGQEAAEAAYALDGRCAILRAKTTERRGRDGTQAIDRSYINGFTGVSSSSWGYPPKNDDLSWKIPWDDVGIKPIYGFMI